MCPSIRRLWWLKTSTGGPFGLVALLLMIVLRVEAVSPAQTINLCNFYASPEGNGSGRTSLSPFKIETFLSLAAPGMTLCLLDGIYRGSRSMIHPAPGRSGTSSAPITIRAYHDGGALIDGEFAHIPVALRNNSWWVLEGFNAMRSPRQVAALTDGADGFTGPGSNNNVLRRLVLWDTDIRQNVDVVTHASANDNLWEDCAFFGTGRRVWSVYTGRRNTCRRCWARWEGNTTVRNSGPKRTIDLGYGFRPGAELATNTLWESSLATWNAWSMPQSYDGANAVDGSRDGSHQTDYSIYQKGGTVGTETNPGEVAGHRLVGSIAYIMTREWFHNNASPAHMWGLKYGKSQVIRDGLVVIPSDYPYGREIAAFAIGPNNDSRDGIGSNTASNITSIRRGTDSIGVSWTIRNFSISASADAVANPWSTTGPGANLCYRYVNGLRTTEPLWPWPMNQRIKQATAMAGSYTGPCLNCAGGRRARIATDVTADIEALLGAIPEKCRS